MEEIQMCVGVRKQLIQQERLQRVRNKYFPCQTNNFVIWKQSAEDMILPLLLLFTPKHVYLFIYLPRKKQPCEA